ncbi:hypothetical protein RND71_021601 [Anisodus tanguticus]|uniref:LOB domain-containing protein n=1 Tax=Anisodus tanguticus TaxID=243964 RepID=A0AAE1RYF7_9SOLA|nr:hypothetical protein RND71_021601 [Anisodus tanguticus]
MNNADAIIPKGKCAVCKHQRKRCDVNCQLAPYFPSNKYEDFKNVCRLYRVRNIVSMLNTVTDNEKMAKMTESLILEAKIRSENPVHGCLAVEKELRLKIEETKKELELVQKKTAIYKQLLERSSSDKKKEENSISDTQRFQGCKYDVTMEESTNIEGRPISTSVEPENTRVEFMDTDET